MKLKVVKKYVYLITVTQAETQDLTSQSFMWYSCLFMFPKIVFATKNYKQPAYIKSDLDQTMIMDLMRSEIKVVFWI